MIKNSWLGSSVGSAVRAPSRFAARATRRSGLKWREINMAFTEFQNMIPEHEGDQDLEMRFFIFGQKTKRVGQVDFFQYPGKMEFFQLQPRKSHQAFPDFFKQFGNLRFIPALNPGIVNIKFDFCKRCGAADGQNFFCRPDLKRSPGWKNTA